jgi:putative ABC transport system permease protein
LVYEVEAADSATYMGVGAILATVALIAAYVPAKRATRVDPMEVLLSE